MKHRHARMVDGKVVIEWCSCEDSSYEFAEWVWVEERKL